MDDLVYRTKGYFFFIMDGSFFITTICFIEKEPEILQTAGRLYSLYSVMTFGSESERSGRLPGRWGLVKDNRVALWDM